MLLPVLVTITSDTTPVLAVTCRVWPRRSNLGPIDTYLDAGRKLHTENSSLHHADYFGKLGSFETS